MQIVLLSGPEDTGLGPEISGDPTIALLAQLNRFAGRTLTPPAGGGAIQYVATPFPLGLISALPALVRPAAIDLRAATAAVIIFVDRYRFAPDMGTRQRELTLPSKAWTTRKHSFAPTSNR